MGKWQHRLLNKDFINKQANCIKCGEVKIYQIKYSGIWKCQYGYKESNTRIKNILPRLSNECQICKRQVKLVCDHDHETRKFRGWICYRCNAALERIDNYFDVIMKYTNKNQSVSS